MDEQGGAGGVPLHDDGAQARRRKPHGDRHDDGKTAAADTDEASRLDRPQRSDQLIDRPQQPEKQSGKPREKGTRWVSPQDE
ncbi:hypothetical protein OG625_36050 [Streptomyces sp. NBC_01351]|uniref:hypothetical protein n=1 Tax=Streptomyces sp. NBC_01351 TaxID=2903833 RepID=UPI002E33F636|nr:hypothetical protein [Streptomyces sp. NBC_01351]